MNKIAAVDPKGVDPRLIAVADWLRNEKKSGLNTKEAVQYEKVRTPELLCFGAIFLAAPPEASKAAHSRTQQLPALLP